MKTHRDLINYLSSHEFGISRETLNAMNKIDRRKLLIAIGAPESSVKNAYVDGPVPIVYGQTMSQPSLVAMMIELMDIGGAGGDKKQILEIGTGSVYNALIIGQLLRKKGGTLTTVEIIQPLAASSFKIVNDSKMSNIVSVLHADATKIKCPKKFDRIIATANFENKKHLEKIRKCLKVGGIFIYPVSNSIINSHGDYGQSLIKETKVFTNGKIQINKKLIMQVRFVPIISI